MNSNKYVFVSYSQKDRIFVERLIHDLRSSGINTQYDRDQILAGESWPKGIVRALGLASVVLWILSKHSVTSNWMMYEMGLYSSTGGIVIPVIIDDEGENNIFYDSEVQKVDFRRNYDTALELLKRYLTEIVRSGTPLISEKHKIKGYVFLSYAEEDTIFLGNLRKFLKHYGYAYWDYEESDRDYHAQLYLELEGVIRDAAATLSILSPAWKQSQWTIKEYLFSEEVGTSVFLLKVKELGPTLVIAGMAYIDFTKDSKCGFFKLSKELQRKGL